MDNQSKRDFKGVWIPKNIWLNTELSWMEKLFLVEIDSLDNDKHCFASNSYFAKFFNLSKPRCTQVIKALESKGYLSIDLERSGKQVIKRTLIVNRDKLSKRPIKNIKQPIKNIKQGIKNIKGNRIIQENNTNNNSFKSENENQDLDNDFTDFRELIKQGKPVGRLGHAKAILQNELNLLTFSEHENKLLNDLLFKIRGDLRANNKLNKIDAKATDDQILKAFETSVNHFKETNDPTKYSIAYLKSCINPNVFLRPETDNLNDYKAIVKNTFAHYKNINRSEAAKIESIKDKIKDYLNDNNLDSSETAILNQFKQLFQDLPEYISQKLSYQSIGYIESKTKELLLKIDYRNDERYIYLKNTFGEAKAKQIMNLN
jgi:hypothetical protein